MTIWHDIGEQLRHPRGAGGWAAGRLMGIVNARPNALAVTALDLQTSDDVLELGCGPGYGIELSAAVAHRGVVHGIDQSALMLAEARARNRKAVQSGRVHLYRAMFEELPFPSRSMDKVLAVNVAYFWHQPDAVLREVRRVLRPGGVLAVYVTDAKTMRRWKFADPTTHRLFDAPALTRVLRSGGFGDERIAVASVKLLPGITGLIATLHSPQVAPHLVAERRENHEPERTAVTGAPCP